MRRARGGFEDVTFPKAALSDRVREYIVKAIMSGEMKPGQRIVESALARQLGVSQAPVREAIRDLVLMGFLETAPYKGTFVRSFTAEELYEVYTVRAALESLAARLAAPRATDEDLAMLQGILNEMVEAGKANDGIRMVRLDNVFHETIIKLSGNRLLYHLWQTLRFGYWTIVTTRVSEYNLEELAARHGDLLKALETRNPQKAMTAMRRHIEDLGKPPENYGQENALE